MLIFVFTYITNYPRLKRYQINKAQPNTKHNKKKKNVKLHDFLQQNELASKYFHWTMQQFIFLIEISRQPLETEIQCKLFCEQTELAVSVRSHANDLSFLMFFEPLQFKARLCLWLIQRPFKAILVQKIMLLSTLFCPLMSLVFKDCNPVVARIWCFSCN